MRLAASALLAFSLAFPAAAGEAADDEARLELGRQVFLEIAQPACALCHTLAHAGADRAVGPVLDQLRPDQERVRKAVVEGIGAMPAYEDLSEEEVDAVAHYVSKVAGNPR